MKLTTTCCVAAVLLAGGQLLQAQLPVSKTAGIKLNQLTTGQFEFINLPYKAQPVARGTVTAVATDTVTLDVPAGTFTGLPAGEYAAQVVSGPNTGATFDVASPSGTQIDMVGLSSSSVSLSTNLTQVEVVKKSTLDEVFPNGGQFTGASSAGSADQLLLVSGGSIAQVYYNSTAGEWRNVAGDTAAGGTVLDLNSGAFAIPSGTPGAAEVAGVVPSGDQIVSYSAGSFTSVGSPFNESLTLGDLNGSVTAATTAGSADQVLFASGSGLTQAYRNSSTSTWKNVSTDADLAGGDSTSLGTGFFILGAADNTISFQQP